MSMKKVKLGDTKIEIIDGDRGKNYPSKSDFSTKGFCVFLDASNVTKNGFYFENPLYISKEKSDLMRNGKLKNDDIVITTRGTVGNIAHFDEHINFKNIRINSGMLIIRNSREFNTKYLYYLLKSDIVAEQIRQKTTGSSQPQITVGILKDLDLLIPPLLTQTAIASVLSSIDNKIELNNKINNELENIAKTIYEYWFVQNADRKWKKEKLVNISELVQAGGTPSRKEKSYFQGDINWFTTGELNDTFTLSSIEKISKEAIEQSSAKLFPKGSVLIAIYASPTAGKLGILSEVGTFNQAIAGIVPKGEFSTEYIYMTLLIERYKLLSLASGTAQKNLSTQIVKDFEITIPPTPILQKFNKTVSPIFSAILKNLQESANLAQLRDFLLPLLMNGQVGINKC